MVGSLLKRKNTITYDVGEKVWREETSARELLKLKSFRDIDSEVDENEKHA